MLNNDFYHYFQYKANKKSSGMWLKEILDYFIR